METGLRAEMPMVDEAADIQLTKQELIERYAANRRRNFKKDSRKNYRENQQYKSANESCTTARIKEESRREKVRRDDSGKW